MEADFASGFAIVGDGTWLVGAAQPAAVRGSFSRRWLRGVVCPDRNALSLVEVNRSQGAEAWCSASDRPFLTRIDCGEPVTVVSDKVLIAPAAARSAARLLRVVPMSFTRSIRTTVFSIPEKHDSAAWVVMATRSRTTRVVLPEGESLAVRPDSIVAWTGKRPSGFCPKLSLVDILLPRGPRDLLLDFHGPAIVWIEGSSKRPLMPRAVGKAVF